MKNLLLVFMCIYFFTSNVNAQQSAIHVSKDAIYKLAYDLFNKKQYVAAQHHFKQIINNASNLNENNAVNAEYYHAICAIKLFNGDASYLINEFIRKHPSSNKTKNAILLMGQHQFDRKFYRSALDWFNKLDVYKLTLEEKNEYNFKTGYCYFLLKEFEKAREAFFEIISSENSYKNAAIYYFGHIAYINGMYQTALEHFNKLNKDENFGQIVPYYITQIYYKQEKYNDLINIGEELLKNSIESRKAEISHLLADAYYKTEKYSLAIEAMEKYVKFGGKLSTEDNYQIGYAQFKLKKYTLAIQNFNKIITSSDSIAQNAYYHLGYCYIKTNQKQEAKNAFYKASKFNYSDQIKEDASFSYVKLSYELSNPFEDPKKIIQKFIDSYPNSNQINEVYSMLGNIYLNTKNYSKAINLLESTGIETLKQKIDYQKIAYFRSIELYNNRNWEQSLVFLNKSLEHRIDNRIEAEALYWKAEILFRLKKYTQTIATLKEFQSSSSSSSSDLYLTSFYNLGYAYFKNKDFKSAAKTLRFFIDEKSNQDEIKIHDALVRIGDSYFVTKGYLIAHDFYIKAEEKNGIDSDYALFQAAFCNGLIDRINKKADLLNVLIKKYPESVYIDDAIFQLADTYFLQNKVDKAISYYEKILNEHPGSSYKKQAMLKIGLILYNNNQNKLALNIFKEIVSDFPGTTQAKEAISNAKNVYIEMGNVDEYISWIETVSFVNITESSLDSTTYQAAELFYLKAEYENANRALSGYLNKFDNGIFKLNATYYKAVCDYYSNNKSIALSGFEYVLTKQKNDFTEESLLNAAQLAYELNLNQKSYNYYKNLINTAEMPSSIEKAKIGLMHTSFNLSKFNEAIDYASEVKELSNTEKIDIQLANMYIAQSYRYSEDYNTALKYFNLIIDNSRNKLEAEARLNIAQIQYIFQNYSSAKNEVFDLIDKTPSYKNTVAESFLLLANIYWLTDDIFQATQTLDMLIKNYDNSLIKDQANNLKEQILNSQLNKKLIIKEEIEINLMEFNEINNEN